MCLFPLRTGAGSMRPLALASSQLVALCISCSALAMSGNSCRRGASHGAIGDEPARRQRPLRRGASAKHGGEWRSAAGKRAGMCGGEGRAHLPGGGQPVQQAAGEVGAHGCTGGM